MCSARDRRSPRPGGAARLAAAWPAVLLSLVVACANGASTGSGDRERYADRRVVVQRVIDGDTAILSDGTSVRYIGIDAPERRPVAQCGAAAATEANIEMVEDRTVTLRLDPAETRDRFGRLLAYLEIDGTIVNVELVRKGFSCAFPFGDTRRFREEIAVAEAEAKASRRGVWGVCPRISRGCPPAGE